MKQAKQSSFDQDLISPAFCADPYPVYHRLRSESPVYWSEAWGAWVMTRYEDILTVFRDSRRFSNKDRFTRFLEQLPETTAEEIAPLKDHYVVGMLQSDPPDHTRLRALVNKAFTPRAIEGMRPRIQEIVDQLLDVARDKGEMDVIRDLAYPLPAIVIAEMLGVPPHERDQFIRWSDDIAAFQGTGRAKRETVLRAAKSIRDLEDYFRNLCAKRRGRPESDLMSQLVAAEEQGDKLTEAEMISTCVLLLVAGHETTRNLIGNGTLALLRHPEQASTLRATPDMIVSSVEELLRYDSPLQRGWRRVSEDVVLGGEELVKGQLVFLMLGAANRDPAVFSCPDQLDLRRQDNRHIAFGFGVHFCLGAPLARLEGQIAIQTLFYRFPTLRLVSKDLEWHENIAIHGLKSLPVLF
jgi:hypothetical protein